MNRLQTSLAIVGIIGILSGQPAAISAQPTQLLIAQQSEKTYLDQGINKYKQRDYKGAIAGFTEAIRLNPNSDIAYEYRGNVKDDNGDPTGAIADYQQALKINPKNYSTYYNLAITQERLKDYTSAIANYTKAIRPLAKVSGIIAEK